MRIAIFFLACPLFCADLLVQGAIEPELAPLVAALQAKQEVHNSLRLDGFKLTAFSSFPGDPRLMAAALRVKYGRGKVRKGNIGSAFQYNRELDRIRWLRRTYGIDTEDMESAFSAGVAAGMNVPFLAVRIVSDSEWSHPAFEKIAGEYCAQFTTDMIRAMP